MKLEPNIHTLVWGSERWAVSAHASSPSVIAEGPAKGKTLAEARPDFPLLVKIIDAKARLSVQVHPNEAAASLTGGEPKSEMWCILEGGTIYAGLKPGVGESDLRRSIECGRVEELLVRHDAKPFEVYYIPGGLVHSIGEGVKLYEVQQSSNTTYRLYDWGRLGDGGKLRELHVEEALKSVDFSLPPPVARRELACPYFTFTQKDFAEPSRIAAPAGTFLVVYEVASGESTLLEPLENMVVGPGKVFITQ